MGIPWYSTSKDTQNRHFSLVLWLQTWSTTRRSSTRRADTPRGRELIFLLEKKTRIHPYYTEGGPKRWMLCLVVACCRFISLLVVFVRQISHWTSRHHWIFHVISLVWWCYDGFTLEKTESYLPELFKKKNEVGHNESEPSSDLASNDEGLNARQSSFWIAARRADFTLAYTRNVKTFNKAYQEPLPNGKKTHHRRLKAKKMPN